MAWCHLQSFLSWISLAHTTQPLAWVSVIKNTFSLTKLCILTLFFVDVLDKICRTCYHTDPRFGTKPYYGVHASTHPQVHIHQNHRDYPLVFHNWWMWRTMAWCHLQTFPSCISLGHTHYQSLSWVPVSDIYLCNDKSQPFLKMNTPLK